MENPCQTKGFQMKGEKTQGVKPPITSGQPGDQGNQGNQPPNQDGLDEKTRSEQRLQLQEEITQIYQTLVEKPKNAHVDLQINLTVVEKLLHEAMDERAKGTKAMGARIKIQAEEAKIMTNKELQILKDKTKLETQMEKEAMKRYNDLKNAVNKVKQIAESNEKNILNLKNKRRSAETKIEKMLEKLMTKETQAKLKRERAEAILNSGEILKKEKTLQKIFIQKQMAKIEKVEAQIASESN